MSSDPRTPSNRRLRVGESLRHALARVLERGEVHDPGLAGTPVTVTEVRVSPDLRKATAFVTPFGSADSERVIEALNRAKAFLRRRVAGSVQLKYVPDLQFRIDTSFDTATQIDRLLRDPRVARDLEGDQDAEEPGDA